MSKTTLAVILVLVSSISIPSFSAQRKDKDKDDTNQPHMQAALEHLRKAEWELNHAAANKGGHREQALKLVRDAMNQVDAGIRYNDQHTGKNKAPKR